MDQKPRDEDLPHRNQQALEEAAEESREQLDKVPEHGTDPLHEGP